MRECAWCGVDCDSGIGCYRELKTQYWGGIRDGNIAYSEKLVTFFCSEDHRNEYLATGQTGGAEIQTDRWSNTGDD